MQQLFKKKNCVELLRLTQTNIMDAIAISYLIQNHAFVKWYQFVQIYKVVLRVNISHEHVDSSYMFIHYVRFACTNLYIYIYNINFVHWQHTYGEGENGGMDSGPYWHNLSHIS